VTLFSFDPGVTKVGIACWRDGVLVAAETLTSPSMDATPGLVAAWVQGFGHPEARAIVTERMHKRPGQTLFNEDLDRVEAVRLQIPRLLGRRNWTKTYNPTQWKGNLPKAVHHRRLLKALTEAEAPLWPAGHDARDAVGIGLFHLGRVKRGGILP